MMQNPYQPPQGPPTLSQGSSARGAFTLAGVAALLASLYWAALTLLIGYGAAAGSTSPTQIIMPIVLIVLYAYRGIQLFQGDVAAARRILWLHGLGALVAVFQLMKASGLLVGLVGAKVAINIFGVVTALLAVRAYERSQSGPAI